MDLDESRTRPEGLADSRRSRSGRLIKVVAGVVGVVLVAAAAIALLTRDDGSDDTASPASSTSTTSSSSTTASTTTSTAAPTTTVPPTPTSVPGVNVGALVGGPGPIPIVHRIPTTDPVVFITIDDGAFADPDALALIMDHQIPVTLFLNQSFMKANGSYFQEMQAAGAVIGSHTSTHANLRGKDAAFQHAEICDLVPQFTQLFGQAPTLFRPPYGNYDATTLQQAASCGNVAAFHWSVTADDGVIATADGPIRAGDIVLMHFKPGLALRMVAVLQQIQAAGLRPARLADYVASAPPAPPPPPPAPPAPPVDPATTAAPVSPAPPAG